MATCIQCGKWWNSWGSNDPGDEFCGSGCSAEYTKILITDIEYLKEKLLCEDRELLTSICNKINQLHPFELTEILNV